MIPSSQEHFHCFTLSDWWSCITCAGSAATAAAVAVAAAIAAACTMSRLCAGFISDDSCNMSFSACRTGIEPKTLQTQSLEKSKLLERVGSWAMRHVGKWPVVETATRFWACCLFYHLCSSHPWQNPFFPICNMLPFSLADCRSCSFSWPCLPACQLSFFFAALQTLVRIFILYPLDWV